MPVERGLELLDPRCEGRVEQRHLVAVSPQQGRQKQSGERRIGLHPRLLLGILIQEIRVRDQDHYLIRSLSIRFEFSLYLLYI